jgi:hypothetical protein
MRICISFCENPSTHPFFPHSSEAYKWSLHFYFILARSHEKSLFPKLEMPRKFAKQQLFVTKHLHKINFDEMHVARKKNRHHPEKKTVEETSRDWNKIIQSRIASSTRTMKKTTRTSSLFNIYSNFNHAKNSLKLQTKR